MEAPKWTKNELLAYVLLYAANSDFKDDNKERNLINSKVSRDTFNTIFLEFEKDNDYQSIQKIIASVEAHNYNKADYNSLLSDIKSLFFADNEFDVREHSMLLFLKRILK